MTTVTRFHPFHPAAALLARPARTTRRTAAAADVRRLAASPARWQQSVRIHEGRALVERLVCLLLVVLTLAAITYGALVTVRTFDGDGCQRAAGRIAAHGTR